MNKIEVKLLLYSEASATNKRLATFVITAPKFIYAHVISHRVFSRNSSSSRAIPMKRIRSSVLNNPFIPVYFGENQPGMQSGEAIRGVRLWLSRKLWLSARYIPCLFHFLAEKIGIHKEVVNRMIEPWLLVDFIITSTEWDNFILLRKNQAAQPEMQVIATRIDALLKNTKPQILEVGDWHLPFVLDTEKELGLEIKKKISAARCARVSYRLFNGKDSSIESDIKLCEKLISSGHWSPFEHQSRALNTLESSANFIGWKQYRKELEG